MLSCYAQGSEAEGPNQQSASSYANLSEGSNGHLVPEEDEEEDVDFNPFLKETPSPEASSSLSSDNEGFGAGVVDNVGDSLVFKEINSLSTRGRNNKNDDLIHCQVSHEEACDKKSEAAATRKPKKKKSASTTQLEIGSIYPEKCNAPNTTVPINDNASTSGTEVVEDVSQVQLTDLRNPSKCVTDWDDEDAICRRTRARYSLANFTLDELETFLQETDDDDDLRNVDDEQEYRKFLTAVLHGGDDEIHPIQENENLYDEDEENDADFEIEIEEALESDLEENIRDKYRKEKYGGAGRRPETRQNKRQKVSVQNKKKILGQANRPLRPLLPFVPNAQMATFPGFGPQKLMPEVSFQCPSSSTQAGLLNGFTPHQIGQLHCLIHEHVQLLVQVFSLCVLDPSRQHIVGELKRMISEIICKRDEVLAWRKVPYPDFCFRPPHIHPSVSNGLLKFSRMEGPVDSSSAPCPQKGIPDMDDMTLVSHSISHSKGRYDEHVHGGHADPLQTAESSPWVPLINDPVLSIIDVAPVPLLGSYMNVVSKAVQEYRQHHVESMFDGHHGREPLFPLATSPLSAEASCGRLLGESNSQSSSTVNSSLPGHQKPKKTLAATLVESTKKQSVALVPKQIVKLAQRFYPLFNSALFPHKPPPAPVANRVLFTDAEDELLALGLMEYNTDWKAIQQRFLPCKTKHQIFVRQKNRCSSKAPENPIKAVRRMKTSPLTAEEKARIHEGLRVLKLDWMSVWRFIVPYRDPSLLPRQWRTALGIQKSYKSDAVKREKRRLYESQRRKCKAATLAHWETASEKEDYLVDNVGEGGDYKVVDEDEACVHEAFLADWGSGNSRIASELPISNPSTRDLQPYSVVPDIVVETPACNDNVLSQPQNGYTHEFLSTLNCSQNGWNVSHLTHLRCDSPNSASHHSGPIGQSKSSKNQVNLRPYRVHRKNVAQLVRLAPDLPPVNLPPSVRIISQSVFESHHCGSSCSTKNSGSAVTENLVPRPAHVAKSGTVSSADSRKNKVTSSSQSAINLCPRDQRVFMDQLLMEEKGTESDLQMHPLLFQAREDANFRYCQMNASRTFNFLPGNQLHANFNHMSTSQDTAYPVHNSYKTSLSKENAASSFSVEFHPLLQRVDDPSNDAVVFSADRMSIDSELFPGTFTHLQNCSDSAMTDQHINSGGHLGTAPELAGSYEKTNDIDLEIHLCSTSSRDKLMGKSNFTKHSSDGSGIGLWNGSMRQFQKFNIQSQKGNENCPRDSIAVADSSRGHAQSDNALVLACTTISRYSEDTIGDHSLPEIVMEQEELSDSEEEIGELVEFECEEMADSEGEESDCDQLVNIQNKEIPSVPTEEEVSTNATRKEQQCEPSSSFGLSEDKECGITKKSTRCSQNLGLASKGKDKSNTGLLLSLDSPVPVSCHTRSKLGENANSRDSQTASNLSSRPSRSCKKMMRNPRTIQTQMRPLEILQPNHLTTPGDTGVITRKPRKRTYRSNAGGVATGKLEYVGNIDLVKNHPNEACPSRNHASTKKGSDLGLLESFTFFRSK